MRIIAVISAFLLITDFYFWLSVGKYLNFHAYAFDLGIYSQAAWLISGFKIPISTIRGINQFADHFSPVFIILSSGYRLFNSPVYLLIAQITSVVLGGLPVYLIGRRLLGSYSSTILLILSYFFQIGLISAVGFDFHLSTLSVGFISWTIYFWYYKRTRLYLIFLIFSLLTKEDNSFLFTFFSLYLFYKREIAKAWVTLFLSMSWYFMSTKIIMPYFLGGSYGYDKLGLWFEGWDVKAVTLARTFGQNLGLSLLDPLGWAFALPNFLSRFLSNGSPRWSTDWHYGANIAAPLFISVIFLLSKFRSRKFVLLASLLIFLSTIYISWSLIPKYQKVNFGRIEKLLQLIPEDANVSAQDVFVPHLANRENLYLFPEGSQADYFVLSPGFPSWPAERQFLSSKIAELSKSRDYETFSEQGVYVFRRLPTGVD